MTELSGMYAEAGEMYYVGSDVAPLTVGELKFAFTVELRKSLRHLE